MDCIEDKKGEPVVQGAKVAKIEISTLATSPQSAAVLKSVVATPSGKRVLQYFVREGNICAAVTPMSRRPTSPIFEQEVTVRPGDEGREKKMGDETLYHHFGEKKSVTS